MRDAPEEVVKAATRLIADKNLGTLLKYLLDEAVSDLVSSDNSDMDALKYAHARWQYLDDLRSEVERIASQS